MKIKSFYDAEEDILSIDVAGGDYWKSIELPGGILIDISKDGEVIGLEIWQASKLFLGDKRKVLEAARVL